MRMLIIMFMIAHAFRMRQLMSLGDVLQKLFAVLLHFQGDVDVRGRDIGSSGDTLGCEGARVELTLGLVIEVVLVGEGLLLICWVQLGFKVLLWHHRVLDIDVD